MNARTVAAVPLALIAAGMIATVIIFLLLTRSLERADTAWMTGLYDDSPQAAELTPRDLAELHEEARRITGEAQ